MKFIKPFYGVKAGDIYPHQFVVGDDCPPELEGAAKATGCLELKALSGAPENKRGKK